MAPQQIKAVTRKILVLCIVSLAMNLNSAASQTLFLNNSLLYVHSDNASGTTIDHEFGYFHNLNDFISVGPSLEFFYFANNGNTTHVLLGNANIMFSKQVGKLIPCVAFSASFSRVFPKDDGHALSATAGTSFVVNDNISFFLQGRYFKFSNSVELGRFLTQFGMSYTF